MVPVGSSPLLKREFRWDEVLWEKVNGNADGWRSEGARSGRDAADDSFMSLNSSLMNSGAHWLVV